MSHHLLPVKHFHLIFTLPHELNDLIFYNQRIMYGLLFRVAWQSIQQVLGGGKTGMVTTLHSWGSNLSYHPHLHCIVPAGSFKDGTWQHSNPLNPRFFCNAKLLRETFKDLFLDALLKVVEFEDLRWENHSIHTAETFPKIRKIYQKIKRKKWTVRIENPVLGTEQIIEYLARYVRRVAITNSRIEQLNDQKIIINYKQYALQKQGKPPPIGKVEFIGTAFLQQFSQHFMPSRFHKTRYYGCYSFSAKKIKAAIYTQISGQKTTHYKAPPKRDLIKKMLGHDPDVCTNCGVFNAFVTEKLTTQLNLLFILTRPNPLHLIRADPNRTKYKIAG